MTVDPIHGTDVESLAFHLPVLDTTNDDDDDSIRFHSAFRHTTHEGPHSLQVTCAKYFVDTQAAFDHSVHDLSMWSFAPDKGGGGVALRWNAETKRVECYRDGKTTTGCTLLRSRDAVSMLPSGPSSMYPSCPILEGHRNASSLCQLGQTWRRLKNAGDKCFSYSGYHRLVVTNPHDVHNNITTTTAALHLESVPGRPFCKFASWSNDEATCHAKRTQWYMTLGCCKSYGTIVADERAKGHPLPDRGDVGALVYEKTFAALDKSDSHIGARPPRLVAAPWDDRDSTSTTDDPSLLLHTLMQQWVPYCTQQKRGSSRTVAPSDETDMDETDVMWCRRVREWHVATCFLNPFAPVWCKLSLQSSSSSSLWISGGGDGGSGGEGGVVVVVNTQCQANTSTGVFRVDTAVDDVALACLNLPPSSEPFGVAFALLHVTPKPTWTEPGLALIGFAAGAMTMWIIVVWIWPVDEKKTVRRRRRQAEGNSSDEYCLDMVML
ncbi:hypothetical protein DYB37_012630 [Aphanomyces astaci]|uniref:Uncharacterized protein n=1 Tax=Aphanomyces astaci TaxID=112090 RepID=A0A3R7A736_APHAT|nr:hypothetical protein DYB37_012630 [Aphanomyces astaci]